MFTPKDMNKIATGLRKSLGLPWEVTVVHKDAELNLFDPSCAYVEARLLILRVLVTVDGEIYVDEYDPLQIPEGTSPGEVPSVVLNHMQGLHNRETGSSRTVPNP